MTQARSSGPEGAHPDPREGPAVQPVPVGRRVAEGDARRLWRARDRGHPACEMCGAAVVAAHCKRICLRCGFMTGCSEGI